MFIPTETRSPNFLEIFMKLKIYAKRTKGTYVDYGCSHKYSPKTSEYTGTFSERDFQVYNVSRAEGFITLKLSNVDVTAPTSIPVTLCKKCRSLVAKNLKVLNILKYPKVK